MERRSHRWIAALVAAWASTQAAAVVTDADRQQLYKEFRTLFDAKRYPEALPVAEKLVSMTEQQYALRVAETAYGKNDPRMLKPLDRYGHWLEQVGRYTTARLLYARALTIAEQSGGRGSVLAVEPLQGIARSYRLEFVNGAEEV